MGKIYGSMEGGGTKFVCAVGTGPDTIIEEIRFQTTTPNETLEHAISFFKKYTAWQPSAWLPLDRWI